MDLQLGWCLAEGYWNVDHMGPCGSARTLALALALVLWLKLVLRDVWFSAGRSLFHQILDQRGISTPNTSGTTLQDDDKPWYFLSFCVSYCDSLFACFSLCPEYYSQTKYPITWLSTIQHDLRFHNLTLPEAVDMAQNRPLWRLLSMSGATQS